MSVIIFMKNQTLLIAKLRSAKNTSSTKSGIDVSAQRLKQKGKFLHLYDCHPFICF